MSKFGYFIIGKMDLKLVFLKDPGKLTTTLVGALGLGHRQVTKGIP